MSTACRSRSDPRWLAAGIAALVLAAALVPLGFVVDAPSICAFRNLTGIPCPGCGLTRSVVATAHLRVGDAFAFHPFGPPLLAGAVVWAGLVFAGGDPGQLDWRRSRILHLIVTVWLVWAVARAI